MFYFVLRCYCSIKVACANFDDSSYNGNVKLKKINARNHEDYSKYNFRNFKTFSTNLLRLHVSSQKK